MEAAKSIVLPLTHDLSAASLQPFQSSFATAECYEKPALRKRRLTSSVSLNHSKPAAAKYQLIEEHVSVCMSDEELEEGNYARSVQWNDEPGLISDDSDDVHSDNADVTSESLEYGLEASADMVGLEVDNESLLVPADHDSPIYPNARLTNSASMLLIMTFAVVHKLSGEALKDLLSLIDLHCLFPHALIQSLHKFKKYFNMLKNPITKHHYCPNCCSHLDSENTCCPNSLCTKTFCDDKPPFFIEVPIKDQLQTLLKRKGFYNNLKHRFERKKHKLGTIQDIYDGTKYQAHMQTGGFLSEPHNISLTWNTDGVPVFKSSKCSIWPLYFAINELPAEIRWSSNNVMLAGLWFGPTKPNMLTFFKPFTDTLCQLYAGIQLYSPDIESSFLCRIMLLCGTCDLPAKASVYNMVQFNGHYGCTHCLQKGETLALEGRGNVHVYPYIPDNPAGPLRTSDELDVQSREAVKNKAPEFGVKGPSWLSVIPDYSVVKGNVVDYMHCVLSGITKMMLKLWFDSEHSHELWYCGTRIREADSKLLQIKPPLTITRTPRSIQQHRAYWKASEYRAWVLFYSIPVMFGILPQEYFVHHMLLVEAIYLLLQDTIESSELSQADILLQHYCFKLGHYYGARFMTANVHHLLHLAQVVRNFGPLYGYSCFAYEGLNGQLLSYIKGTQYIESQILEKVAIKQSLPYIAASQLVADSEEYQLYHHMTAVKRTSEKQTLIGKKYHALGAIVKTNVLNDPNHQKALHTVTKSSNLGLFKRVTVGFQIFHSLQHTLAKKRNSYTVMYRYNGKQNCGEILYFVTDFQSVFAVIAPFVSPQSIFPDDDITNCTIPHFRVYTGRSTNTTHVVELGSLKLCIAMCFEESPTVIFVAQQPNNIEKD